MWKRIVRSDQWEKLTYVKAKDGDTGKEAQVWRGSLISLSLSFQPRSSLRGCLCFSLFHHRHSWSCSYHHYALHCSHERRMAWQHGGMGMCNQIRATKRDWKRAKNLRANAGKMPVTSRQILVSGVSVRRRGPLTGIWSFISRAGHPLKGYCAFTNIQRYLQHSGRKLYHAQLWICNVRRNAETIVS